MEFDAEYWDEHWRDTGDPAPAHPYLASELDGLVAGRALDAGSGEGAEAIWLAERGWTVTAADISPTALATAAARARSAGVDGIDWVEADLTTWAPDAPFDLVMTNYAHPTMPQLDFYERVATWVAPGGTLLIVGHLHGGHGDEHGHGHGHDHGHDGDDELPLAAQTAADEVVARLDGWQIVTALETERHVGSRHLRDVVVRARAPRADA